MLIKRIVINCKYNPKNVDIQTKWNNEILRLLQ